MCCGTLSINTTEVFPKHLRPRWGLREEKSGGPFNNCVKDFPQCLQVVLVAHENSSDSVGGNVSHFFIEYEKAMEKVSNCGKWEMGRVLEECIFIYFGVPLTDQFLCIGVQG